MVCETLPLFINMPFTVLDFVRGGMEEKCQVVKWTLACLTVVRRESCLQRPQANHDCIYRLILTRDSIIDQNE